MMSTTRTDDHAGHDHAAGANVRSLAIALALTGGFLIAELAGAYIFNSLALLSDAAHMFTDAMALAIALLAIRIGQRPPDDRRTFGYRRFEILAAAFNAILLFLVAGYIMWEGIGRFYDPQPVQSLGMLAVAAIGLIVNLIAMRILTTGKDRSLNLKGAYLEVWADMLGSVGVIAAAIAIRLTGANWIDPVVAIVIGLWVLPRTWMLLRDAMNILLQGVPHGMALADIRAAIETVEGVTGVHDLHVWAVSSDETTLTAHIVASTDPEAVRRAVNAMLAAQFGIRHVTLQVETALDDEGDAMHR
jgi:cobalt-zinc-cadmium efflux system protein